MLRKELLSNMPEAYSSSPAIPCSSWGEDTSVFQLAIIFWGLRRYCGCRRWDETNLQGEDISIGIELVMANEFKLNGVVNLVSE